MNVSLWAVVFCTAASVLAFVVARRRAVRLDAAGETLHSRPGHHGWRAAFFSAGLAAVTFAFIALVDGPLTNAIIVTSLPDDVRALGGDERAELMRDVRRLAASGQWEGAEAVRADAAANYALVRTRIGQLGGILAALAALVGMFRALRDSGASLKARDSVETVIHWGLMACSAIAVLTTFGIISSLAFETARFFTMVGPHDFLFGLKWSPQTALRADQVGASGAFGAVPVLWGTVMIAAIAMMVAAPLGLFSAIFLSEYAGPRVRGAVKPALELLAGVPTVVYGFFALLTIGPLVRTGAIWLGEHVPFLAALSDTPAQTALAAGLVMGVMIIPFVSSLSDDVINAVPQSLRDGALAVGATKSETVRYVVLPAALPGVMGALLLAVSRAVGETMIVVMAAGRAANLTVNPLDSVTTVTVQIVALLTGDQEFDSAKTLSAFALGAVLFVATLMMNIIALRVVHRYRNRYE